MAANIARSSPNLIPADSDREPPISFTIVYDPKTSLRPTCTPDYERTCRQDPLRSYLQHPT